MTSVQPGGAEGGEVRPPDERAEPSGIASEVLVEGGAETSEWRMGRFEILAVVVLSALSLSVIASVLDAIFNSSPVNGGPPQSTVQHVGAILQNLGQSGEISGLIFLAGAIALLSWRMKVWNTSYRASYDLPDDEELGPASIDLMSKVLGLCNWARALATVFVIDQCLEVVASLIDRYNNSWALSVGRIGFTLAYLSVAVCVLVLAWHVCEECRGFFVNEELDMEAAVGESAV